VEKEIRRTLKIVQEEFRSDIYGFGQILRRKKPHVWQQFAEDWNEKTFPALDVQVAVRSRVRTSGLVLRRARP